MQVLGRPSTELHLSTGSAAPGTVENPLPQPAGGPKVLQGIRVLALVCCECTLGEYVQDMMSQQMANRGMIVLI